MRGYVELSQGNGTSLCIKCLKAMSEYKYEYEEVNKSSWFGLKTQKYRNCPFLHTEKQVKAALYRIS